MANIVTDTVSRLLSQYTFDIDSESLNENLTCSICNKLMIDAYQTYCGCQYCRHCIVDYLSESERHCCGGKTECREECLVLESNVLRNVMLNRKILKVKVICPNESCTYSTELVNMEQHLRICNKQSIECPFSSIGCDNVRESKDRILTHLHNDPFTHIELLIEYIHGMKNEFEQMKKDLQLKEIRFEEQKRDIEDLKEEFRNKEVLSQTRIEELRKEVTNLRRDNESMKEEMETMKTTMKEEMETMKTTMKGEMETMKTTMKEEMEKMKTTMKKEMATTKLAMKGEMETMKSTMKGETETMKKEMETMKSTMKEETEKRARTENDARTRMDKLEATIEGINIGTNTMVAIGATMFTVDRFSARKTSEDDIYSPYFYTHTNGYKVRLNVYPGGDGYGKGTHLSVFTVICKGEYDDLLPWPCKYGFTVSIINQINKETHTAMTRSHSTAADNCKDCYDKPTNKDNDGHGSRPFISHTDLHSVNGLIVDDCVIIKCVVTPPQ